MEKSRQEKRWYIAGPFFNLDQVDVIRTIEHVLTVEEVSFFAPREQNISTTPMTSDIAKQTFSNNCIELEKSDVILAVVDWTLPPTQKLLLTDWSCVKMKEVHFPDSGTAWELGYAFSMKRNKMMNSLRDEVEIIGYTNQAPSSAQLNLMLTQGMDGVCFGVDSLRGIIRGEDLLPWTGKEV